MPEHDNPKNKPKGRESPPPVPPMRPERTPTARFRVAKAEEIPQERRIAPIPKGARSTASIATPIPDAVAALISRPPEEEEELEPYVPGNTLMPAPIRPSHTPDPEEEKKKAEKAEENDARFLRFANALYRASEIMQEDWVNWIAEPSLLRENIGNAVEYLKEKRNENEDYASDHKMLKAFSGMVSKDERLNEYLLWVQEKEKNFLEMSHVYASISMGPLTPYSEVIGACRERAHSDESWQAGKGVVGFLAMVGDTEEYQGTAYLKGEIYKRMFDSWYMRKAARAIVEVQDVSRIAEERNGALLRVGALIKEVEVFRKQNAQLIEDSKSNIPPRVIEEVHNLRAEKNGLVAEKSTLESSLRQTRGAFAEAAEENMALTESLHSANARVSSLEQELAKEKEDSKGLMDRIRILISQNDSLEKRMAEMEERLNKLDSLNMELREKNAELSEELELAREPDLPGRPTMHSGLFEAAAEEEAIPQRTPADRSSMQDLRKLAEVTGRVEQEGPILGEIEKEVGAALEEVLPKPEEEPVRVEESGSGRVRSVDAATEVSMIPAVEAARMARGIQPVEEEEAAVPERPGKEITEILGLEEMEEIPVAAERGRFWNTLPGRAIHSIAVYGLAGKGEKMLRPKEPSVEFTEDTVDVWDQHNAAVSEYEKWYNRTGREVRDLRDSLASATRRNWKKITAVASSTVVLAAAATGYFMYAPAQERPEEVALKQLQSGPSVTQVAAVDEAAPEKVPEVKKVEPKPEPLEKPALAGVLARHGLELEKGTNMARFYTDLNIEDVQERYVVLEEALRSDELMEKYERKYSEGPILEMYADFLNTAMEYVGLEGQADAEKAGAREAGLRVAKRLEDRVQQKRIKKKVGKERAAEMRDLAIEFSDFASSLPSAETVQPEEEKIVELPVVTPEELEEMKKAGEEPEVPVIILPDKSGEKPFKIEEEMEKVITAEFQSLDTPEKVNEFDRKAGKVKKEKLKERFLMQAHLSQQIVEHGMETSMSEKRVLFMQIETMNAAILFAMEEGQGMTAIAEALDAFDLANGEVKRILGYKKMKELREKKEKNLRWLRNRAEELRGKVDAYDKNKDLPVPLPGSPSVENRNGVPTATPGKMRLDRSNEYAAIQTLVFSENGLSILEHPLKVHGQMKGKKINSFDKFIILENLAERIMYDARWMDGLSKAEQFEMLKMLAAYLRAANRAANTPKDWREGYDAQRIILESSAIYVSDTLEELAKLGRANLPEKQKHLQFPLDQETFHEISAASKEFLEQLNYRFRQKSSLLDDNGE